MNSISKNISLNIYEPETSLKIYRNTNKKSIITKIIKNPDIAPAKKQIKIKYNNINKNSIHLSEYNIFQKPGEKILRRTRKEEYEFNGNIFKEKNQNFKCDKKNKTKIFLINRKFLEKINLNKNIPNDIYDYLHPYEYNLYSRNNKPLKNYLRMQINAKDKDLNKNKGFKNLKLIDNEKLDKNLLLTKFKSSGLFLPLKNNLRTVPNKKMSYTSKNLKFSKTMDDNINIIKNSFNKNKNSINNKISSKLIRLKTSKNQESYNDECDSSSLSFTEQINNNKLNTVTNFKKRLFINGKEITCFNNLLYYNTIASKNIRKKQTSLSKRPKTTQKYNQRIFNRNNNVLDSYDSYEQMKKYVLKTECEKSEYSEKKIKKQKLIFNFDDIFSPICYSNKGLVDKNKKIKLIKEISKLNHALSEIKFYMIAEKIDREKYSQKLDELEKKMDYKEDRAMITKDILFEKFNNADNQNEYISHATNKNQYVNKLISSYVNFNEKKTDGLLDKQFLGGLKKLSDFGAKDAMIRDVIGENNYFIKHSINKIEEVEISKNRKYLGENMKKIMHMVKMMVKRRKNLGKEKTNNY